MPIHIETSDLNLNIRLTPGIEGWVTCNMEFSGPGFTGGYPANLEIYNFRKFLNELQEMYAKPGIVKQAVLEGREPGIFIKLTSSKSGSISGEYEFNNFLKDWKLIGRFVMDQSYLPPMISDIQMFLQEVSQ